MPDSTQRSSSANVMRDLGPYLTVGTQATFTVLAFILAGWYIDERNASSPLWIGILGGVGAMVGLVNLIRSLNSLSKKVMKQAAVDTTVTKEEN